MEAEIHAIVENLRRLTVEHREYRIAEEALFAHATFAGPGTVVLLVGPSRVGKTKVARSVLSKLSSAVETDSTQRLSLWVEAVNPDRGRFSLKHLTLRLLTELDHPFFREADPYSERPGYSPRREATEPKLRIAVERAMQARRTHWLFIDEAHHITQTNTASYARNYLDSLKSLGNTTGVVSIWISGYPIFQHGFLNPHLNGRMRVIHMPRYTSGSHDMEEFHAILETLSSRLPIKKGWSLSDAAWQLREHSFGCVGALVSWTEAALAEMVCQRHSALSLGHYQATRYSLQLEGVEQEIQAGEALVSHVDLVDDATLRSRRMSQDKQREVQRPKPFQRLPKRDPVGQR